MKSTAFAALAVALGFSAAAFGDETAGSKHYVLPATTDNVQWGWYDVNEKPKLSIKSGDRKSVV